MATATTTEITIVAKFDGKCSQCVDKIRKGAKVLYNTSARTARHLTCTGAPHPVAVRDLNPGTTALAECYRRCAGWPVGAVDQSAVEAFCADAPGASAEQIDRVINQLTASIRQRINNKTVNVETMAAIADRLAAMQS